MERVAAVAIAVTFGLEAWAILAGSHIYLVHRLPDDAFYYLEIGRHLARGDGLTFDGLSSTNGVHPLWQAVVTLLATVLHGDALVRAVLLVGLAAFYGSVLLVVRILRRVVGLPLALLGGFVALRAGAVGTAVNGMEGAAVVLAYAVLATVLVRLDERPSGRRAAVVGVACSALALARLDLALVALVVLVAVAARTRSRTVVLGWLGGAAAIGVPFAAWYLGSSHHLLTTSATVKQHAVSAAVTDQYGGYLTTGYARSLLDGLGTYVQSLLADATSVVVGRDTVIEVVLGLVLVVSAIGGAVLLVLGRRAARATDHDAPDDRRPAESRPQRIRWSPAAWALGVVVVAIVLKAIFDLVAAPAWAEAWYSPPARVAVGMTAGVLIGVAVLAVVDARRPLGIALAVVVGVGLLPFGLSRATDAPGATPVDHIWQDQIDLATDWVAANGPPGRYGAYDAGLLGYRLDGDRAVVNLDGLVNDYDYAAFLPGTTPLDTVRHEGIDVLVQRLTTSQLAELGCARRLWTSPGSIYADGANETDPAAVVVLDTRPCLE